MRVFISHSHRDKPFAAILNKALRDAGVEVWIDEMEILPGDNIVKKIDQGLSSSDAIIVLLSKDYVSSKWAMQELSVFTARSISEEDIRILPILLEDCDLPIYLRDRLYIDARTHSEAAIRKAVESVVRVHEPEAKDRVEVDRSDSKRSSLEFHREKLSTHFRNGELTLVCGAGVSAGAGVPTWSILLNELLGSLIGRKLQTELKDNEDRKLLAQLYQDHFGPSSLVVGQYLKNGLGDDFMATIRGALYSESLKSSELLDAISDLCRPQRSRESLNSIITFNFDDLIERSLESKQIKYRSIFGEGQKADRSELPIYHVHGFLPRDGQLEKENEIVFSEDAYHSQFIDPFSWSNLTQLNLLSHNVCLFVGLSLSDPNLRRLLDVSMRKNPDRLANHYVFKKRSDHEHLRAKIESLNLTADEAKTAKDFVSMWEILEEQDSKNLGLNTLWVDDYSEIPQFLKELAENA